MKARLEENTSKQLRLKIAAGYYYKHINTHNKFPLTVNIPITIFNPGKQSIIADLTYIELTLLE